MGTRPAVLKSRSRVNDGSQHRVVVDRLGRAGSISVDRDETVHVTSQGPLQMLNVNGDIYFGHLVQSLRCSTYLCILPVQDA
ncbi:hypothetical protein DPMN_130616 [Dreissena polymorpha]|uniref:Laminin G domain-containing protein n=1 Tax=Dreissena polymorpha TaxID=45954 RepID=A0A9D4JZB2_DREPO|nr:hypothetical protein DPMN_130616 [Dreissena polymorpha]